MFYALGVTSSHHDIMSTSTVATKNKFKKIKRNALMRPLISLGLHVKCPLITLIF